MTCKECVCFWTDEGERYPSCHFEKRTCFDVAPCEYEDEPEVEPEDIPDGWDRWECEQTRDDWDEEG